MTQKIIPSYTPQMQADETAIQERIGIKNGVAGAGGRSKAIAHAINQWAQAIKNSPTTFEQGMKLTAYVEEYVRNTYAGPEDGTERASLYFKDATLSEMELIGEWLDKFKNDVPMLMPVLMPSGQRKKSAYNHTLIITLALARAARGTV